MLILQGRFGEPNQGLGVLLCLRSGTQRGRGGAGGHTDRARDKTLREKCGARTRKRKQQGYSRDERKQQG